MRGYGDQVWRETWDGRAERLRELASRIDAQRDETGAAARRSRHSDVVTLLIESGELAQAVIDAEFGGRQQDGFSLLHAAALELVRTAAEAVIESMEHVELRTPLRALAPQIRAQLARVHQLGAPSELAIRDAEGFSFYAVYPELYAMAAARLPREKRRVVIGARTIGVTLGAIVAAALDAETFVTLRPVGDPFRREIVLDDELRDEILCGADEYAIVDEGPGLSGSTFGAIADFLEQNGVARERIVFFPSHGGDPGAQASPEHLERWRSAQRQVMPFQSFFLGVTSGSPDPDAKAVIGWTEELIGRFEKPVDISGGQWRRHIAGASGAPSTVTREALKYLVENERGRWMLKFAGLGRRCTRKVEKLQQLAARGLAPRPVGTVHGFIVTEWAGGRVADADRDGAALAKAAADYLQFLARQPVAHAGAPLQALFDSAQTTVGINMGSDAAAESERWRRSVERFARNARPVDGDQRMHLWEWIVTDRGDVMKCDAVDHVRGHDGIGPQDLAWDLAGAAIELRLSAEDEATIRERIGARRRWTDEELDFYRFLYAAAQIARCEQIESELRERWPEEAARWEREKLRYENEVRSVLEAAPRLRSVI